jgi:hypothetical protein
MPGHTMNRLVCVNHTAATTVKIINVNPLAPEAAGLAGVFPADAMAALPPGGPGTGMQLCRVLF